MVNSDFIDYVAEQLRPLGPLRSKRMFGGVGIYIDGLFCAFVADETLYFKSDHTSISEFLKAGCCPFLYSKDGLVQTMQYYRVPDQALDSAEELMYWARLGMGAALRNSSGARAPMNTKLK